MTKFIEQRVEVLENEVAELKLIIHELRGKKSIEPSTTNTVEDIIDQYRKVDREAQVGDVIIIREPADDNVFARINIPHKVVLDKCNELCINDPDDAYVYNNHFGRTSKTVEVYELIEQKLVEKSPNQQRAQVIEKSKAFVKNIVGEYDTFNTTIGKYKDQCVRPIFQVNEKKRAITVLIYSAFGKQLIFKGLTKCKPNDVFNEHIGKAISLGRALGLDVSEFEQAVQPTKAVNGQLLTFESGFPTIYEVIDINSNSSLEIIQDSNSENIGKPAFGDFSKDLKPLKIINDTNAKYEV